MGNNSSLEYDRLAERQRMKEHRKNDVRIAIRNLTIDQWTVEELKEACRLFHLPGFSRMRKTEIINLLCRHLREDDHPLTTSMKGDATCPICMEEEIRLCCFDPCGHVACVSCGNKMKEDAQHACAMCKVHIHKLIPLYI
jgi:hypothetical protein